jgi:hypothetical protein
MLRRGTCEIIDEATLRPPDDPRPDDAIRDAPEQPDIVTQRHFLVFDLDRLRLRHGPLLAAVVHGRPIPAGIMPCDPNRINRSRPVCGSHYAQL